MSDDIDLVELGEWLLVGRALDRALERWPARTRIIDAASQAPLSRAYQLAAPAVAAGHRDAVIARRVPDRPAGRDATARTAADIAELESRMVTDSLVLAISQSEDGGIVGIAAFSPESSDAWTETVVLAPGSMTLDVAEVALARLELWMTAQVDKPAQIEDGR